MSRFAVFTCAVFSVGTFVLFALFLAHEHPEHKHPVLAHEHPEHEHPILAHEHPDRQQTPNPKSAQTPKDAPEKKSKQQTAEGQAISSYTAKALELLQRKTELSEVIRQSHPLSFGQCVLVLQGIEKDLGVEPERILWGPKIKSARWDVDNMGSLMVTCSKADGLILFAKAKFSVLL